MSFWTTLLKGKSGKSADHRAKAAGVVKNEDGWYYEESQNFSRTQSTVRIEQNRPGNWETLQSSCGVIGLNQPSRKEDVERFFAGTYRWLRLEREAAGFQTANAVKVIGTYRDTAGKERAVHLGHLNQEAAEEVAGEDLRRLWGKIRFIRFPSPGRDSRYMVRFDLMRRT